MITAVVEEFATAHATTMLELGSGGGNNASHLKHRFQMTLSDLSPAMLDLSRTINPELEHIVGDMRTVRLGRLFDTVLVHDAICYLRSVEDVSAALRTVAEHLSPGGVAVICPDDTLETLRTSAECGGHDGDDGRSMRYLMWTHPLDDDGCTYRTTFVYALREGNAPSVIEHEEHVFGAFSRNEWLEMLEAAGLRARLIGETKYGIDTGSERDIFVGIKA